MKKTKRLEFTCKECGFSLWNPISKKMPVSHIGLYNDGRFPGRCLLVLDEHYEHLHEAPFELMEGFIKDMQGVGEAIKKAFNPDRINYAILGNAVPHIHCHIIPRYHKNDPLPNSTPWSRRDKAWEMPKEKLQEIGELISKNLPIADADEIKQNPEGLANLQRILRGKF